MIPDIYNPRYSYSGGKILNELLAIHYTANCGLRTIICRPHNFYGPDMGIGHVIPQFILRMKKLQEEGNNPENIFTIQGRGDESRAFCYIDDAIDGLLLATVKGSDKGIYHLGTQEEISINHLATEISRLFKIKIKIKPGSLLPGGTSRRCPDISKICSLGYEPKFTLEDGLKKTIAWYVERSNIELNYNNNGITR